MMASTINKATDSLNLKIICDLLGHIKSNWHEVGVQLGIPYYKLNEFEKSQDPLAAVIDHWLKGNTDVPISWSSIVEALNSRSVGESGLARTIQNTYCQQSISNQQEKDLTNGEHRQADKCENVEGAEATSEGSADCIDPKVKKDLEFVLADKLDGIVTKYAEYVQCVRAGLQDKEVELEDLRSFMLSLPAFSKCGKNDKILTLFSNRKHELFKVNSITKMIDFLQTECASFLNYYIFEKILSHYRISREDERLKYPKHLKTYANSHKIEEFKKLNPHLQSKSSSAEEIKLKIDIETTCDLAKIDDISIFLAKTLNLNPSALNLVNIDEGCIIMTFHIPKLAAEVLFTPEIDFTAQQKKEFQEASVLWLRCRGHQFNFSDMIEKDDRRSAQHYSEAELPPVKKRRLCLQNVEDGKHFGSEKSCQFPSTQQNADREMESLNPEEVLQLSVKYHDYQVRLSNYFGAVYAKFINEHVRANDLIVFLLGTSFLIKQEQTTQVSQKLVTMLEQSESVEAIFTLLMELSFLDYEFIDCLVEEYFNDARMEGKKYFKIFVSKHELLGNNPNIRKFMFNTKILGCNLILLQQSVSELFDQDPKPLCILDVKSINSDFKVEIEKFHNIIYIESKLHQHYKKIKIKFASYLRYVHKSLIDIPVNDLRFTIKSLPYHYKEAASEAFEKAKTVDEMFMILGKFCSFWDFDVLIFLMREYYLDEDERSQEYIEQFKNFIYCHKASLFTEMSSELKLIDSQEKVKNCFIFDFDSIGSSITSISLEEVVASTLPQCPSLLHFISLSTLQNDNSMDADGKIPVELDADSHYHFRKDYWSIGKKYASYTRTMREQLKGCCVDAEDLRDTLITMPVFKDKIDTANELMESKTVDSIFDVLIKNCRFYNYRVFECLAEKYGVQSDSQYANDFRKYIEKLHVTGNTFKFNFGVTECNIDELKSAISYSLGIAEKNLRLLDATVSGIGDSSTLREGGLEFVRWQHNATNEEELSVSKGDEVMLIEKVEHNYWKVELNDTIGQVPAKCFYPRIKVMWPYTSEDKTEVTVQEKEIVGMVNKDVRKESRKMCKIWKENGSQGLVPQHCFYRRYKVYQDHTSTNGEFIVRIGDEVGLIEGTSEDDYWRVYFKGTTELIPRNCFNKPVTESPNSPQIFSPH